MTPKFSNIGKLMELWIAAILVLLLNLPFGYWRGNVRKFSLQWALAIHIPVPAVIAIRLLGHLGFQFVTYPVLVGSFFTGQFAGKMLLNYFKERKSPSVSSCLVMDIYRGVVKNSRYSNFSKKIIRTTPKNQ